MPNPTREEVRVTLTTIRRDMQSMLTRLDTEMREYAQYDSMLDHATEQLCGCLRETSRIISYVSSHGYRLTPYTSSQILGYLYECRAQYSTYYHALSDCGMAARQVSGYGGMTAGVAARRDMQLLSDCVTRFGALVGTNK